MNGSPNFHNCQKPYAYFNLEDESAQGPKATCSQAIRHTSQPRDLTASIYMRGRSFHSSAFNLSAKGNSRKSLIQESHDSMSTDNDSLNPLKGSKSKNPLLKKGMSISSWTKIELNKYMSKNGKYNGIINILSNPLFLQACYLEIKSKPGNMSKGVTNETDLRWY